MFDPNLCAPLSECQVFTVTGSTVPAGIRVYGHEPGPTVGGRDPFENPLISCDSDANLAYGDIDLSRCRGNGPVIPITPAYDPHTPTSQSASDPLTRAPLTWVAEFDAMHPAPTLVRGEDLWIEFVLRDVR